jgi:hypothetical protein
MFASKFTPKAPGVSMFATGAVLEKDQPEVLEEGIARLTIVDVTDLGMVPGPFGTKRKLKVALESPVDSKKYPGKKVTLFMTCTASLSDASNFGAFVKSLGLDNNVVKFPVGQLKGISFDANVVNTVSDKTGLTYSNLDAVIGGTVKVPTVQTI